MTGHKLSELHAIYQQANTEATNLASKADDISNESLRAVYLKSLISHLNTKLVALTGQSTGGCNAKD